MSSLELNKDQMSIIRSAIDHNSRKSMSGIKPNTRDLKRSEYSGKPDKKKNRKTVSNPKLRNFKEKMQDW